MNVYKEPFDINSIPTPVLLRAAQERRKEEKAKHGPWAINRKLSKCPHCKREVGVREMTVHKQAHRRGKKCPDERAYYRH